MILLGLYRAFIGRRDSGHTHTATGTR
jgi:hypothetical protein